MPRGGKLSDYPLGCTFHAGRLSCMQGLELLCNPRFHLMSVGWNMLSTWISTPVYITWVVSKMNLVMKSALYSSIICHVFVILLENKTAKSPEPNFTPKSVKDDRILKWKKNGQLISSNFTRMQQNFCKVLTRIPGHWNASFAFAKSLYCPKGELKVADHKGYQ